MATEPMRCERFAAWVEERCAFVSRSEVVAFARHYYACAPCQEQHGGRELFRQQVMAAVQDADPEGSALLSRWEDTLKAFEALAKQGKNTRTSVRPGRKSAVPRKSQKARK